MTQGTVILYVGLGIIAGTLLLALLLNLVCAGQKKKLKQIVQDDYGEKLNNK